jgi:hypothetical protein
MGRATNDEGADFCKSYAQQQEEEVAKINFNDRKVILDLIEFTRNSSPGYGITVILENFIKQQNRKEAKRLASDTDTLEKMSSLFYRFLKQ